MKKIWMMLLMVSTVFAFTACSDDDDEVPVNPISGVTINSPVEIGKELIIKGAGFAQDAEFYFKDEAGKLSEAIKGTITSTTASFTVPMSMEPGKYTLVLRQDGDWELGEVMLEPADCPIDNPVVPATAWIGRNMTIEGSGFNATSEIYLQQEGNEPIKLTVTDYSAGLTCEVPADVEAGTYSVVLKQDGGEWTLEGTVVVEKAPKRLVKITTKTSIDVTDYSEYEVFYEQMAPMYEQYGKHLPTLEEFKQEIENANTTIVKEFVYDGYLLKSIKQNDKELFAISSTENQIVGTNQLDGELKKFTFTIDNNRIIESPIEYERVNTYTWNYNENGTLNNLYGSKGLLYEQFYYENGNFIGLSEDSDFFQFKESTWKNHIYGMDIAMFLYSEDENNNVDDFIPLALELGYTGISSNNIPSQMFDFMLDDYIPLTYTWDEDGYVNSISIEKEGVDPVVFSIPATTSITYSFEYIE